MQDTHSPTAQLLEIELANGCQLQVLEAVDAQQCALALSLAAGSHDEPAAHLGMAHFLEHLVFRGSCNYPLDNGLMAFMQRSGGHVNAKTQARETLFHFQTKPSLFVDALKRLVDMLVSPRLEDEMLITEREVLNEEFHLYCRAPQILMDAALGFCLLGEHSLQRFYAGNRQTLSIENTDFAASLRAFHQRAYLRSKLKIVLVIPDGWGKWQDQVLAVLQPLICQPRHEQSQTLPRLAVPADCEIKLELPIAEPFFVLHIPINSCAEGLQELAEKMQHALVLRFAQSFLDYAQKQRWCSAIAVRAPYVAQGQGVLTLEFKRLSAELDGILPAFRQWLEQWREQLRSPEQQAYELQAQLRRWSRADSLRKAQQILTGCWPLQGVTAECLAALDRVIEAVHSDAFVQVHAGPEQVFGVYDAGLPLNVEREGQGRRDIINPATGGSAPFVVGLTVPTANMCELRTALCSTEYALAQYHPLGFPKDIAVCYWGWSVHDPKGTEQSLQARLTSLVEQFSYHAVHWQVEVLPGHVFLRITGPADYLAVAISQILTELEQPLVDVPFVASSPFALRRLLQRLPGLLVNTDNPSATTEIALPSQPQAALWLGDANSAMQLSPFYLKRLKNLSVVKDAQLLATGWHQVSACATDDSLLIVHIPLPAIGMLEQDRMRVINKVFAQHFQSVLQRRLRDELGLCYAVFVMPHVQVEREGLVCAVQSSKVEAHLLLKEISQCLMTFLQGQRECLPATHADILLQISQLEQGAQHVEHLSHRLFRRWSEQRLEKDAKEEDTTAQLLTFADIEKYYDAIQDEKSWFILSNQHAS